MNDEGDRKRHDSNTKELVTWLQAQPALASHLKVLLVRLTGIDGAIAPPAGSA